MSPGVAMVRHFDEPIVPYTGRADWTYLTSFMETERIPSVSDFREEYVDPIFKWGKPAVILFHTQKESALHDAFAKTAKSYKGNEHKMIFVTA